MDELIKQYWVQIGWLVRAEARRWHTSEEDMEDVFQDTVARILRYPPKMERAKSPEKYFLGYVQLNAKTVIMTLRGYHNGDKRPQSVKAEGEQNTKPAGLYQPNPEGDSSLMDERILPLVPSAEDTYLATLPNKRQEALRGALETLPERQRTAVTLRYYEALSVDEVASEMGLTVRQAYNALGAGMALLRKQLDKGGIRHG